MVYSDAATAESYWEAVGPVLSALRDTGLPVTAGFLVRASTLTSRTLRQVIDECAVAGIASVVELRGLWNSASLLSLLACGPTFVRIGPDYVYGVANLADQFRSLVQLTEFAQANAIQLVARGMPAPHELDALRIAGIGMFSETTSGVGDGVLLDDLGDSLTDPGGANVLRFPMRPLMRG